MKWISPYFSRRRFLSLSGLLGIAGVGADGAAALAQTISRRDVFNSDTDGPAESISLNDKEYFSGPGFAFLVFHNHYLGGMQGGLQMIQNGERILDSGDFFLTPRDHLPRPGLTALRREVNHEQQTATVYGKVESWKLGYQLICRTGGNSILVTLKLSQAIDWSKVRQAGFRIYIYPACYFSKSFQADGGGGVFPRQFTGRTVLAGGARKLSVAAEDPAHAFIISRNDGTLDLRDPRQRSPQPWFSVSAPLTPGSEDTEITVTISPNVDPHWRRAPVIGVSQVGYHPDQRKRAVLELDPRDQETGLAHLYRLAPNGDKKLILSGTPADWGKFLHYHYKVFDLSEVRQTGIYMLEYAGQEAGPFKIDRNVYDRAWEPALEYFLPIQMCHIEVIEGVRSWHGACHLDDARQAPARTNWTDSYRQGALETRFAANEHIPGLNWGGWHDAGDFDLPSGSIALTTLALALAQEEFSPGLDRTTINRAARKLFLHVPNGRSDLLQQIEYGAESLLASYRLAGHIFGGIIETEGYTHLGDSVNITDNLIYDPKLKPAQVECGRSGNPDDRWAFTNRNTGLQYQAAQTLAVASRVLDDYNHSLALECAVTAEKLWDYEQGHTPVYWLCSYNPSDSGFRCEEILATAELLLTTDDPRYRDRLLALLPVIESISGEQFGQRWPIPPGWTLVRILRHMREGKFQSVVIERARQWQEISRSYAASNPYGVPFPPSISNPDWRFLAPVKNTAADVWGYGWNFLWEAFRQYYYHKHLPGIFGLEPILNVVNYVFGCHPANNETLVSGVGDRSPLAAYGFNRADWSYIPGGVISGPSLIKPGFMELKHFPFLWYQTEYVIHGAAAYIFTVLAARAA